MAQWVKNPTAAAQVAAEVQVWSLAQHSGLKDPVLLHLQHRLKLWLGFNPQPRNFHMPQVQQLKKEKRERERKMFYEH